MTFLFIYIFCVCLAGRPLFSKVRVGNKHWHSNEIIIIIISCFGGDDSSTFHFLANLYFSAKLGLSVAGLFRVWSIDSFRLAARLKVKLAIAREREVCSSLGKVPSNK